MDNPVSVLIVTYNSAAYVGGCLDSLRGQRGLGQVMVWDNASADGSVEVVAGHPGVVLHRSEINLGFAAAVNRAAAQLPGHLLLLNPDATLRRGAVAALRRALGMDPKIAALGCMLEVEGGLPQQAAWRFPTPRLMTLGSVFGLGMAYRPRSEDRGLWLDVGDAFIPFTAALLRREAFDQLGGLDEGFFVYGEDADFCYRAHRLGWKMAVCRGAWATHIGQHADRDGSSAVQQLRGGERFVKKHFSAAAANGAIRVHHLGARARLGPLGRALLSDSERHAPGWRAVADYYGSKRKQKR
jgi:N-acetylglucosaminyl-diphospho-decaprenol L-rhamnosyltransferase